MVETQACNDNVDDRAVLDEARAAALKSSTVVVDDGESGENNVLGTLNNIV